MNITCVLMPEDKEGGCQGQGVARHYRASGTCDDGRVVMQCRSTEEDAKHAAADTISEINTELMKSHTVQLENICSAERMCSSDMERAIRLIQKIIANHEGI